MLRNPHDLAAGIKRRRSRARVRREARGGATLERRAQALAAEMGEKRECYQDLAADGLMTKDELRAKLSAMDSRRKEAERELARIRSAAEKEASAVREAESLVESMSKVSEALEELHRLPHRHRWVYERMGLSVVVAEDKSLELTGEIRDFGKVRVCLEDATSTR